MNGAEPINPTKIAIKVAFHDAFGKKREIETQMVTKTATPRA